YWKKYYPGAAADQYFQRHFSYSDRIRYYWPKAKARTAVDALMGSLAGVAIPRPLLSQYLAHLEPLVSEGRIAPTASDLVGASVERILNIYAQAID
ncbi:class II D-tagatose-bisphosphate aldolase, non-catalytic subunit, partial [Rhizobium sp. TRM95111]|uniref:class II D-tagatose-bisphosphate aldolase non-catalytic subunit n=1 Tax=Rhizobium alarense TaxID=2846851 RepID=UPI001F2B531F